MMRHNRSVLTMKPKQKGFSLLEMIVAIVVMTISFGALYQAVAGASRIVRIDETYSYAHGIAQSLLANYAVVPLDGVSKSGDIDDTFHWTVKAIPIESDISEKLASGALQSLVVSVSWDANRNITLNSVAAGRDEDDYED